MWCRKALQSTGFRKQRRMPIQGIGKFSVLIVPFQLRALKGWAPGEQHGNY